MSDGTRWKINCYDSAPGGGVHFGNGENQDQENGDDNHTNNNRLGPVTHFSNRRRTLPEDLLLVQQSSFAFSSDSQQSALQNMLITAIGSATAGSSATYLEGEDS